MRPFTVFQQLRCLTPSYLRRRPLWYVLSVLAVASGVALFVSMRITQASLIATFTANVQAMSGRANYVIRADGGVAAGVLPTVEAIPGVTAAPLVRASAVLTEPRQGVTVIGVDPSRELKMRDYHPADRSHQLDLPTLMLQPDAVVLPDALASRYGWKLRSPIQISAVNGTRTFVIGGLLSGDGVGGLFGGDVVFMRTDAAQRLLGREGRFDAIDIAVADDASRDRVAAALPSGCSLEPTPRSNQTFDYLLAQFQIILGTVTVLACLFALFVVYNTASLSVVERVKALGTLRALGARPGEVLAVFVTEAALLGLIGAVLGAAGGRIIADLAVQQSATALNIMLSLGAVRTVVPPDVWITGPLVGLLAAVLGAAVPARTASRVAPIEALRAASFVQLFGLRHGWLSWLSIPLAAASVFIVRHPQTGWGLTVAGITAGVLAAALAAPKFVLWLGAPLRRICERRLGVAAYLGLDNILKFPSRTALTVVAFGGSLGLIVGIAATVRGLEQDVDQWMDALFAFDLTIQANDLSTSAYGNEHFSDDVLDEVRRDPRCEIAYGVRAAFIHFGADPILVIAYEVDQYERVQSARGRPEHGHAAPPVSAADVAAADVITIGVSDNFARIHGVSIGERISLPTTGGERSFSIAAIEKDLSWFRGTIFVDLRAFHELWIRPGLTYVDIRVRPGADLEQLRADLIERYANRGLFVHRVGEIKEVANRFLREWFALANVQLLLAVTVGGVGVANTLLMSLLTQTRQIGMLRAIGASLGHIRRMLAYEAGYLGLCGGLTGAVLGLLTVLVFVRPMAIKASGFDLPMVVPYGWIATTMAAALVIALVAALFPMRAARRIDVVQAIGYE